MQSKKQRRRMSPVWNILRKTLNCKSETSEVYEPNPRHSRTRTRCINSNSCCRSTLKDVKDHDDQMMSNRFKEKRPTNFSPLSIRSSDLINPFTNLVRLSNQSGGGSPYVAAVSPGSRLANYINVSVAESWPGGFFRAFTYHKCDEPLTNQRSARRGLILKGNRDDLEVIAGRVHKPMVAKNLHELVGGRRSGFDSLAGKMGYNSSHIEELYLWNPTALLPCFVIVCK
ncbi:hypothetical protein Cgig2_004257 [Carnegiea gigantea]|uniref:Uncharacterized protein n=1 Tax=Carnegiea gigantea TaxID=171969 RepID=A0A9Q1QI47_9CARY|nr:hypothetical protein Cgig2_004257 [Carnegiea gigantea]